MPIKLSSFDEPANIKKVLPEKQKNLRLGNDRHRRTYNDFAVVMLLFGANKLQELAQ